MDDRKVQIEPLPEEHSETRQPQVATKLTKTDGLEKHVLTDKRLKALEKAREAKKQKALMRAKMEQERLKEEILPQVEEKIPDTIPQDWSNNPDIHQRIGGIEKMLLQLSETLNYNVKSGGNSGHGQQNSVSTPVENRQIIPRSFSSSLPSRQNVEAAGQSQQVKASSNSFMF